MSQTGDAADADHMTQAPPEPEPIERLKLQAIDDDHRREDWEAAAAAVLRRAKRLTDDDLDSAVWHELSRTTLDGVDVGPLGHPEMAEGLMTEGRPTRATPWDIRTQHRGNPGAVNQESLADLTGGVNSLWLMLDDELTADGLVQALDGVHLDLAPVVLQASSSATSAVVDGLVAALAGRTPAPGTNLGVDPISTAVRVGEAEAAGDVRAEVAQAARSARAMGTRALVVDGSVVHDLGAADAQEMGWTMAVGLAYLRALADDGVGVSEAAGLMEFRYAATGEQFPTIAKLRAARRLWRRVVEVSGGAPVAQQQHAVTSRPMLSKYDSYVNILRTTVAAFAAGVGGADAVTVLPFDSPLGRPTAQGRRIARNISHLLIQESHVARVADPAGGAYAVERLTDELAQAAWAELGRIEAAGGALAAIAEVRERIAAVAERRDQEVATRIRPVTGTSEYPDLAEELPERSGAGDEVRRYGAAFEALRDQPVTGSVFLATMGPIASHTARAGFASNLLAAGGIPVAVAGATEGIDDVIAAYRASSRPPVVCLAGTDEAYAASGTELIAALRAAGAAYVILAGVPGDRSGIPESAVDDAAASGVNAVAFLTRIREALA